MSGNMRQQTLTVASGATVSSTFVASGFNDFGVILPSTFDGTSLTFEVGYANSGTITWMGLFNLATNVTLTVAASRAYPLSTAAVAGLDLKPWQYWRLITAAQTGATEIVAFGKSS